MFHPRRMLFLHALPSPELINERNFYVYNFGIRLMRGFASIYLKALQFKVAEHSFRAHALANAIQRAHKDGKKRTCRRYGDHFICSMPALSVLFFFIIEPIVLRVLVFYYEGLLEKVTMQRTQQFSAFFLLPEEPS